MRADNESQKLALCKECDMYLLQGEGLLQRDPRFYLTTAFPISGSVKWYYQWSGNYSGVN